MTWLLSVLGWNVPRWVMWVGVGLLLLAAAWIAWDRHKAALMKEGARRLQERIRNRIEADDEKARKARDDAGSGSDRDRRLRDKYRRP